MFSSLRLTDLANWTQGKLKGPSIEGLAVGSLSTDTRTLNSGEVFIALKGEKFDANEFLEHAAEKKPALIIAEKEIPDPPVPFLLVPDSLKALVTIARELRSRFKGTVIGITGSAGKSSTKEMVSVLLGPHTVKSPASFNNLLGVSKTLWLVEDSTQNLVLEMGMNHLGEIAELCSEFRPQIGAITNIGDAHIGKLGGKEGIYKAKKEMFDFLAANPSLSRGVAVNADDPLVEKAFRESGIKATVNRYGYEGDEVRLLGSQVNEKTGYLEVHLRIKGSERVVPLALFGSHHAQNIVAAISIATLAGTSLQDIWDRIPQLKPAYHRGEIINLPDNRLLIDESYNSNPTALISALKTLSQLDPTRRRVLVIGEMRELGEFTHELHRQVGEKLVESQWDRKAPMIVIGVGEATIDFLEPIRKHLPSVPCLHVPVAKDAINQVQSLLKNGDILFVKGSRGVQLDTLVAAFHKDRRESMH